MKRIITIITVLVALTTAVFADHLHVELEDEGYKMYMSSWYLPMRDSMAAQHWDVEVLSSAYDNDFKGLHKKVYDMMVLPEDISELFSIAWNRVIEKDEKFIDQYVNATGILEYLVGFHNPEGDEAFIYLVVHVDSSGEVKRRFAAVYSSEEIE